MQKYSEVVLDKNGKGIAGATITVTTYPNATPATIYAADGGPSVLSVQTDNAGRFSFYAANGHYSITVSGQGITPITYNDVTLFDPKDLSATQISYGGRTLADKLGDVVSVKDSPFNAKGDGIADDTAAINAALSSGALRVTGAGKKYRVTTVVIPAGVSFDGQGGELLSSGSTVQDVVATGGIGGAIMNWSIRSNVPGTRKGRYGILVAHASFTMRNIVVRDITYSAIFNDAEGTDAIGIYAENCGWDAISNYQNAKNSTFHVVKAVKNGRSLISTDVGAKGITLDGFESVDNGLDEITTEHKDVLHFEGASDCVFRNGTVRYTTSYAQGTINQTWAIMRWNNSSNCVIENVDIKAESSANGKLILGQVDSISGAHNTKCAAININVDSSAIPSHQLVFYGYDGSARFRLIGGFWTGYITIQSAVAGGNAFETISDIDASGTGTGTFMYSQYVTNDWTIQRIKIRGYQTAYNLNGFQGSSLRDLEIEGANFNVFYLLNSNAATAYQPDGGVIANVILRGTLGTILQTNNQQTRALLMTGVRVDGSATKGLDTSGGTAGATSANVKALGNLVAGTLTTVQSGTNSAGALNANMNNIAT